jgi:hypothetical protein
MKKLIAISSLLALVLAGSGLFAVDIPVGDGDGKFTLDLQAEYEFDIITDANEAHDNDKTWIGELDADKQAKVSVASYDGDNYAFGVGAGFQQKRATDKEVSGSDREWYLDNAWGKYYLLEKQFSIRGGGLAGDWGGTIWDTFTGSWSDDKPGVQLAFAPSFLTGLSVGLSLPVPAPGSRKISNAVDAGPGTWKWTDTNNDNTPQDTELTHTPGTAVKATYGNWGPTYPLVNAVFGLRLNQTIPGLDFSVEAKLNGNAATNKKTGADEGEGDLQGADVHFVGKYTFAPVSLQFSVPITGLAAPKPAGGGDADDPLTKVAVRLIFDIPNGEGSALDLGDPWVQFQMLPNEYVTLNNVWQKVRNDDGYLIVAAKEEKSFKDILIDFEWEPGYSLSESIKAYLWLGVGYKIWGDAPDSSDQKKYPLTVAVRPALEFKFAPSATLKIQDKVSFVRQATEKGLKNELGFRFAWKF